MTIDGAFTRFPTLTTERLRLRQVESRDAGDLYALFADEEAMRYFGDEPFVSLDEAHELIARRLADYAARKTLRWGITFKDDDRVIGSCGFHHFDEGFNRAETGYILNHIFWGQGIMPEARAAILSYGFTEMGLHRIEAIIDIANERSKNLLLKLGFSYEGNLRQRFVFRGAFEDEHYFGLLRDEWQPRTAL